MFAISLQCLLRSGRCIERNPWTSLQLIHRISRTKGQCSRKKVELKLSHAGVLCYAFTPHTFTRSEPDTREYIRFSGTLVNNWIFPIFREKKCVELMQQWEPSQNVKKKKLISVSKEGWEHKLWIWTSRVLFFKWNKLSKRTWISWAE